MKDYTYSVARVRAKEASLLTRQDIDQLLSADGYESALRLIRDRGYRAREGAGVEELASAARRDLWDFLAELKAGEAVDILRLTVDYHNVKAAVKSVFSHTDAQELLLEGGTADPQLIYDSVKLRKYDGLTKPLAAICEEAMTLLLRTQDGQVCDILIDNAMLTAMRAAAEESGDSFLLGYAQLLIDTANLKAAYRCARTERSAAFIENAICPGGAMNARLLSAAASSGLDALYDYLAATPCAGSADAMRAGAAALEKWCADELMRFMDNARWQSFSAAPIVAYYYAKSTEINAVRLILLGKRSQLDDNLIRERVPRTYV